jgi:RHS repeat-associated protein
MHPNHLGSTTPMTFIGVTDETGATIQKTIYYPWGQAWASAGTVKDNRFPGKPGQVASLDPRDAETGNDPTCPDRSGRYNTRMCKPRLYRWLSPDPLAGDVSNPRSLNRYAYVLNNPVNFIDPTGLCPTEPPPGMVWDPTCHVAHHPTCTTGMDCVFKYYRSMACNDLWYRSDQWGPCPSWDWSIGKSDRGNTISDALAGAPGTYITLDMRGNLGFGFDEGLWGQTWSFIDTARAQGGNPPKTGYAAYQVWNPILSAEYRTIAEAVSRTGFIKSLYDLIDRYKLASPYGPYAKCATSQCRVGVESYSIAGGVSLTMGVEIRQTPTAWVPIGPTQTWPFP